MSGATTAFTGGVTDVRPDGLDVVAEATLDASTQSQTTTSGSSGGTSGHSAQSSVTSGTSASTTDETQGEDSNILGRGIRKAVPDGWGEVVLGKPDTKKHSGTSGVSSSTGTTSTVHDEDRHDQSSSTTTSGPGRATTNVIRQAIAMHVTSPPRDAISASVDVTNFGIGTAVFDDAHMGHLLKVLADGEEPTWRERLARGRARITLYGYASLPGTREQNQRLALDRTEAIRRHLIDGGIPASAFDVAIAYGDARTPSTLAEKGGKEREDDDWRKVKVVLTAIPAGHAAAK
jgi:outer membrane protein OmpA-like peptidoglycan-associated protein